MSSPHDQRKSHKGVEGYLRYTGLGITMLGIVLAFIFGGRWLDQQLHWRFPVFTLTGSLLGVAGAMLHLFRETGRR
ncbi:MAG TPA: AtpZ/AtpI family protein [Flavobacteriales bacterium]|nr:AtpZ/AtpI family protein [Flavobacteriales bacterium]